MPNLRFPNWQLAYQAALLEVDPQKLLERVKAAKSGWYWDQQTKLWYVKVDFSDAKEIQSRTFSIF